MSPRSSQAEKTLQTDEALCRSILYDALSLALHYPTTETCGKLLSRETALTLREAALILSAGRRRRSPAPADSAVSAPPAGLESRVVAWTETFSSQTSEGLLTVHGRLFGHTARGTVCPYETEYGP